MKKFLVFISLAFFCGSAFGQAIKLPASRHVAGPLSSKDSSLGDEFYNFPSIFGTRATPGHGYLSGWIEFEFKEPKGNLADFTIRYDAAGSDDQIQFGGGQIYKMLGNRGFNTDGLVNKGTLNLNTGEITEFEIHATFQNATISRVTRNIRIPFAFLNDYPPNDLPVDYPFTDEPRVFRTARFITDSSGNITGFEFRGETIAAVTLFPQLALFPLFSFAEGGTFYFASPVDCAPNAPPANCINWTTNPDGVLLARNAFFHPHFELITSELREVEAVRQGIPAEPVGVASSAGLISIGTRLYHLGGFDGNSATNRVQIFDRTANRWSSGPPMPKAIMAGQSAAVGSKIYVAGGFDLDLAVSVGTLQVLDTVSSTWSTLSPAPIPVSGAAAASVGTKVYIFGGWTNPANGSTALTDQLQIFDTVANAWGAGPPLPLVVAGACAVVVGSDVYLIGGRISDGTMTNKVNIYDTNAKSWRLGMDILRGVSEASAGYINGRIYLVGGRLTVDGPADGARIQLFETTQNLWRVGQEAPVATAASTAAVLDGKLYIAGGRIMATNDPAPGFVTDLIQQYDPGRGWAVSTSRPVFTADDVVTPACGKVGLSELSPGSRAVILGYNFADSSVAAASVRSENGTFTSDLPTVLNGIRIQVDGKPAPVISVSPNQVEFQIPYTVAAPPTGLRQVLLEVIKAGTDPRPVSVLISIRSAAPAIYVHRYGELRNVLYLDTATAIARNPDGRLNHPSNPAHPKEVVSFMVTGLGQVDPPLANGQRSPDNGPQVIATIAAQIGGKDAAVKSAALVAREIGVYEVKVEIPADSLKRNNVPVVMTVGGIQSNAASISVR